MDKSSEQDGLVHKCQELEAAVGLWIAANQAKAERIAELEASHRRLRQRIALLSRRGSQHRSSRFHRVHQAR